MPGDTAGSVYVVDDRDRPGTGVWFQLKEIFPVQLGFRPNLVFPQAGTFAHWPIG